MHQSFSSKGSSGSFTVRTGGKHFIPVDAPLGRVKSSTKLIRPVPPNYVTEYEAEFKWPAAWAYASFCSTPACRSSAPVPVSAPTTGLPDDFTPITHWQSLLDAVTSLLDLGYEPHLLESLKGPVTDRKLHLALEYVNSRFIDTLAAVELHKLENGVCPLVPPESVLRLCKQFTSAVRAIKSH